MAYRVLYIIGDRVGNSFDDNMRMKGQSDKIFDDVVR